MYTQFYNLKEQPFTISTEPRFLWLGEKHQEALANLKYGLLEADGYVVLTGDVGIGKTTLVNALLDDIDDSVLTATISHPTLPPEEFFRFLAKTWGAPQDLRGKTEHLFFFKEFLERSRADGKTILLIIDEAHRLSEELLEEIRLLSNMELQGKRLVNIFFVGQIELKEMLLSPQFRALRQRITLFYDIEPLNIRETAEYIIHRLKIAGGSGSIFNKEAIRQIQRFTRGYPRLINILCARAMLTGYVNNKHRIDSDIIAECVEELGFLDPQSPGVSSSYKSEQQMLREKVILRGEKHASPAFQPPAIPAAHGKVKDMPGEKSGKKKTVPRRREKKKRPEAAIALVLLVALVASAVAWASFTQRGREVATKLEIDRWLPETTFTLPDIIPPRPASPPLPKNEPLASANDRNGGEALPDRSSMAGADDAVPAGSVAGAEVGSGNMSEGEGAGGTEEVTEHEKERGETGKASEDGMGTAQTADLAEKASAALAQRRYEEVIAILASEEDQLEDNGQLAQLYVRALIGRAGNLLESAPDEALTLLEAAIGRDRSAARAHFLLGKIHTAEDRYMAAIDAYQEAVRYDNNSPDTLFNLGFVYAATGKYEQAEHSFLRTVELDPPYMGKALFNLAVVQDRLGKRQESLENLRKARLHSPENKKISAYMEKMNAE